jgi:hypothetical protein
MKLKNHPQLKSRVRNLCAVVATSTALPALAYAGHDNDKNSDRGNQGKGDNDERHGDSQHFCGSRGKRRVGLNSFFRRGPAFFGTKSLPWKGERIEPFSNCTTLRVAIFSMSLGQQSR